jgi:hypothetical protein
MIDATRKRIHICREISNESHIELKYPKTADEFLSIMTKLAERERVS